MLMIVGRYDAYRERTTGERNIQAEWITSPQTKQAIPVKSA